MDFTSLRFIIDDIKKGNKNFIIHTNIINKAYNTIDHQKFYGKRCSNVTNGKPTTVYNTEIVSCINNCLTLKTNNVNTDYPLLDGGIRTVYLNIDSITAIEVIDEIEIISLPVKTKVMFEMKNQISDISD